MDYKEKYKAALSWMKKIYPTLTWADKEDAEHYFPELHESEDERVRLEIHAYLFNTLHNTQQLTPRTNELERWLAYLENKEKPMPDSTELDERWKQEKAMLKEKDFRGNEWRLAYNAYLDGFAYGVSIKQKEQPKEELVYRLNGLMQDYIKEGKDEEEKEHRFKCYQLFWDALEDANFFKQKEQKPNIELIQSSWYMEGYHDREFGQEPKWIIKTGEGGPKRELNPRYGQPLEQKPAEWSLTDATFIEEIDETLFMAETGRNKVVKNQIERERNWLKSLPERFDLQPKQEWSEEDKRAIDRACVALRAYSNGELPEFLPSELLGYADRLQSLRPQPHWKPSEEQMEALEQLAKYPFDNNELSFVDRARLTELVFQLKKL